MSRKGNNLWENYVRHQIKHKNIDNMWICECSGYVLGDKINKK